MVNVFLYIIGIVMFFAIAAANLYILIYFQHEEDKNTAIFPKIVVVVGLTITACNILLLPFDVANSRTGGDLPMETIWLAFYVIVAVLAIGVLPFAIFYYEAEDPDTTNSKQIRSAVIYETVTVVIFVVITVVLWITIGVAEIPVNRLSSGLTPVLEYNQCNNCTTTDDTINYSITFLLYLVSMLAFIGMFLFVVFGGIGLAALPMDLINGYRKRPKFISLQTYIEKKLEIGVRADALLSTGKKLNEKMAKGGGRPSGRSQRNEYNKFRAAVFVLEEDYKIVEKAYNGGIGPRLLQIVWDYTQLVLGVIGVVISIVWLLHIILFVIPQPPVHPFLNSFFIVLDNAFSLFGTLAYGLFAFYLLWCVIKGNFKFGLRIPFIFSIHPMKVGETLMNAFLFNTLLVLLASVTLVQFCSGAFSLYNRFTGIDLLFNVGVRHLRGIKYIWYYYFYGILLFAVLGLIYLIAWPSDRKQVGKNLLEKKK